SKNKASMVLTIIFVVLIVYGLFVFAGTYIFKGGARKGFMEVSGRIEGYEYHAGTRVAGKVDKMYVEEGQKVEKGKPVAHIHSKQLEAILGRTEARLREAESNLHLAELESTRYTRLYKENAIPKMEYDRIVNTHTQAKEEVAAAQKEREKAKADLADTAIRAPVAGVVVTKIVRVGEVVAVGTPLVTMINMDDLYLQIFLATDVAGKVNLGDEAKVFPDSLPRDSFNAYVDKIAEKAEFTPKNVETKSQRAKLVFQIKENTGHKLKPGMPSSGVIKTNKKLSWKHYRRRR
ncbi:HlyD family secretion protein, partial [Candidatus Omnitrophota bacterium]